MNPIAHIKIAFSSYLQKTFNITQQLAQSCNFMLNVEPAKQEFGDLNANAAMVLAKEIKQNPRQVAQQIIDEFKHPFISKIEIAGPGFLNAWLTPQAFHDLATELITKKQQFFSIEEDAPKHRYDIEFVSANPTGPLHLGHGRGAIIGDVLGNILKFFGHHVTKEFYINDAGNQINKLGLSFKVRCQQVLGINAELPEDGYHGEYLVALAKAMHQRIWQRSLQ